VGGDEGRSGRNGSQETGVTSPPSGEVNKGGQHCTHSVVVSTIVLSRSNRAIRVQWRWPLGGHVNFLNVVATR
jgi:hypothetical protein